MISMKKKLNDGKETKKFKNFVVADYSSVFFSLPFLSYLFNSSVAFSAM